MFESKEILEEMFPIGYIYKEEKVSQRFYCADNVVLEKIKEWYGADNVEWISPHHVSYTHYVANTVDGYIYDGTYWYPASHDAQGWHIISEEELKYEH